MATSKEVALSIGFYALCSGGMLFLNKLPLSMGEKLESHFMPGAISCMQLVFTVAFCGILIAAGTIKTSSITNKALQMYMIYGFLFVGSVYSSMMALQGSNVETQIVFRAATPITVSLLDTFFLGRELPETKSALALVVVAVGAVAYVYTDAEFAMNGAAAYGWVTLYYMLICAEMTLGKYMLSAVKLESVWGSVLLTNGLSLPLLFALSWARGDFDNYNAAYDAAPPALWVAILGGCLTGTLIGWAGWNCRGMVSATTYTLVGVANKFLTVLLSVFFLDKHASPMGIAALTVCIAASTQYKQAPLRKKEAGIDEGPGKATEPLMEPKADPESDA